MKVIRTNISPYQSTDFIERERQKLESITNVKYINKLSERPEIILTNTHTDFTNLDLSEVKLIIHPNSGYDNIPFELVKKTSIPIIIGNEIRANAVTSYNIAAICKHFAPLPKHESWSKSRSWPRLLLSEISILIIGNGHVGRRTANALNSLGCNVDIYDPYTLESLQTLPDKLNQYHALILASSLNPTSNKIVSSSLLDRLSPEVLIINSARGNLVDQDALIKFLDKNRDAFAFLDVFEKEPYDGPLSLPNLHPTSHIAGVFTNIDETIIEFEVQTIINFINLDLQSFKQKNQKSLLQNRLRNSFLL